MLQGHLAGPHAESTSQASYSPLYWNVISVVFLVCFTTNNLLPLKFYYHFTVQMVPIYDSWNLKSFPLYDSVKAVLRNHPWNSELWPFPGPVMLGSGRHSSQFAQRAPVWTNNTVATTQDPESCALFHVQDSGQQMTLHYFKTDSVLDGFAQL